MAKGQKRSTREAKKPKATDKKKPPPAGPSAYSTPAGKFKPK
jgi:hypothetical protein